MKRFALLLLLLLSAWNSYSEPLKIGATLPLSGTYSYLGEEFRRGMELAQLEIGAEKVSIIFEDEGIVERAKAVTAFHKLTNVDQVSVIFGSTVNTVSGYGGLANRLAIPVFALWDDNALLRDLGEYVFGFGYSTEDAGELLAKYAITKLKKKRFAIISAHDEWSELIASSFERAVKEAGQEIVIHDIVSPTDTDVRTSLLKAKHLNSDAIFAPLYLQSLSAFLSQAQTLNITATKLLGDAFLEDDLRAAGDTVEGAVLAQVWFDNKDFREKYRNRFNREISAVNLAFVALAYDAVRCIYQISAAAPATRDRKLLKERLTSSRCEGIMGPVSFANDRSLKRQETILQVKNGQFVVAPE